MLRALVLLLVLANGAFFLWSQGHLQTWGLAPDDQREPERLQQQIAPETVRLLNTPRDSAEPPAPAPEGEPAAVIDAAETAAPPATPAPEPQEPAAVPSPVPAAASPAPPQPVVKPAPAVAPAAATPATPVATSGTRACWQASGFTEAQADGLRASLALLGLPAGSWQLREVRSPARWLVYLGRFDNMAQLERRRAELRSLKVEARTVNIPGLAPGLSLSNHPSEAAAREAQQTALRGGIRGARVAQAFAESVSYTLRLPAASPVQLSAVAGLGPVLAGKSLQACN
jgi:cell division protein FtsN